MKLQDQVITEEQADKMKRLGIDQDALYYHTHSEKWGVMPKGSIDFSGDPSAAFTVAELGTMLPAGYDTMRFTEHPEDRWFGYDTSGDTFPGEDCWKTEAEARGAMLIHLLETNTITAEEVNARLKA